jgi:shikimate 5-dehydrogenase
VAQLKAFNETVTAPWQIIDGLENVMEGAFETFELLTGRPAPRKIMREACQQALEDQMR